MWKPAVSGMEKVRIRRYLVLLLKAAEKHVTLVM